MNDTEPTVGSASWKREHLSALMDGELDAEAADGCCSRWREQTAARADWHAYHLIGDVLRSQELACGGVRDARLFEAVRSRLATEPVVLAPGTTAGGAGAASGAGWSLPATAAMPRRRSWRAPAAVAAGFVVAGVMVVARSPEAPSSKGVIALVPLPAAGNVPQPAVASVREPASPTEAAPAFSEGQPTADAQSGRYLAAHMQFGGSSALGVPSGFLRSATLQAPAR